MRNTRPTAPAGRRIVLWVVLFGTIVTACAIPIPPSGGPEDKTSPAVVGTAPRGDSVGVSPDSKISITFSEDMMRKQVDKLVTLSPEVEIEGVDWKDQTLTLTPAAPLHPETTYVVTIAPGFRDNHNVPAQSDFRFAFATSASIDSGTISGRVLFRRKPTKNGIVRCFVLPKDTSFTQEASRPDREVKTDDEGKYTLEYLPTRGHQILVWAFEDANNNGSFAPNDEVGLVPADTVVLSTVVPAFPNNDLYIVDPKEPAVLTGIVSNQTGADTVLVSVALSAVNDSTPPTYFIKCDESGAYELKNVYANSYLLQAFIDFRPDSLCGLYPCPDDSATMCREPCVTYPDTIVLNPGDEVELKNLVLEAPVPERMENADEN